MIGTLLRGRSARIAHLHQETPFGGPRSKPPSRRSPGGQPGRPRTG